MGPFRAVRRSRGFTLIELMIVVAIVGVLAMLAVVGYRHWTQSAYLAEGQDMVAHIRASEDAFYSENGAYLKVSTGLGAPHDYPAATPGSFKTAWDGACGTCVAANSWVTLGVHANAPVIFGYSVIAGDGVTVTTSTITNQWGSPSLSGTAINLTNMANGQPWYFIEGDANVSGDGTSYMHVYGMSHTNQIFVDGEGK